eukprot:877523-Prymnesium_polylepis.1
MAPRAAATRRGGPSRWHRRPGAWRRARAGRCPGASDPAPRPARPALRRRARRPARHHCAEGSPQRRAAARV